MRVSWTEATLNEGRATEEKPTEMSRAVDNAINLFFQGVAVDMLEDYSWFGHLEISKRVVQPESSGPSPSSKLEKKFPAPSVDPERKKTFMFSMSVDTSMLSRPVRVASYLLSLVTEDDQIKMNEVGGPNLFNEAQHALNLVCLLSFLLERVLISPTIFNGLLFCILSLGASPRELPPI